jgi:small subunit ribosomal protein S1
VTDDSTLTPEPEAGPSESSTPLPEIPEDNAPADASTAEVDVGAAGAPDDEAVPHDGEAVSPPAGERAPHARPPRRKPRDPAIARAFRAGLPVDGTVEKVIKGGYEVQVGKCRGFCPHSQIDLHRVDTPEEQIGKTFKFMILQMRHGGDDVVVSRRALLEADRVEEAKAVRATLIEGTVTEGRVARLADFGAFVDLGAGVTGLVHVSEISTARVINASDVLHVGDRVSVRILRLESGTGRISLSIRQAQEDPWKGIAARYPVGKVCTGTVARLSDFGAFVELESGIEALAAARDFPPAAGGWQDGLECGASREWVVVSVEPDRWRMSLAPVPAGGAAAEPLSLEAGAKLRGKVQKVERFGVFVWLAPGQVGLVPNVWTGTPRGTDLFRHFPVGQDVEVTLVEVVDGGRRIRLTMDEAATAAGEEAPPRRSRAPSAGPERPAPSARDRRPREEEVPAQPGASFGTSLGDALKSAFDKKRDRES